MHNPALAANEMDTTKVLFGRVKRYISTTWDHYQGYNWTLFAATILMLKVMITKLRYLLSEYSTQEVFVFVLQFLMCFSFCVSMLGLFLIYTNERRPRLRRAMFLDKNLKYKNVVSVFPFNWFGYCYRQCKRRLINYKINFLVKYFSPSSSFIDDMMVREDLTHNKSFRPEYLEHLRKVREYRDALDQGLKVYPEDYIDDEYLEVYYRTFHMTDRFISEDYTRRDNRYIPRDLIDNSPRRASYLSVGREILEFCTLDDRNVIFIMMLCYSILSYFNYEIFLPTLFVLCFPFVLLSRHHAHKATRHLKSRDKALLNYDYRGCFVRSVSFDARNESWIVNNSARVLSRLKGQTFVYLRDQRILRFSFPLMHVNARDFIEFLSNRVHTREDFRFYQDINVNNRQEYALLFGVLREPPRLMRSLFVDVNELFQGVFLFPLLEEIIKEYTGLVLPLLELYFRICEAQLDWAILLPFLVHASSLYLPNFGYRFLYHAFYNLMVTITDWADMAMFPMYYKDDQGKRKNVTPRELWTNSMFKSGKSLRNPMSIDEMNNLLAVKAYEDKKEEESQWAKRKLKELELVEQFKRSQNNEIEEKADEPEVRLKIGSKKIFKTAGRVLRGEDIELKISPILAQDDLDRLQTPPTIVPELTFEGLMRSEFVRNVASIHIICRAMLNLQFDMVIAQLISSDWLFPLYHLLKGTESYTEGLTADEASAFLKGIIGDLMKQSTPIMKVSFTSDEGRILNRIIGLMPEGVRTSPTTKHVFTLGMCVIGAIFCRDFSVFEKIVKKLAFPHLHLSEETFVEGFFSLFEGLWRVWSSGEWKDFFRDPATVILRRDIDEILMTEPHLLEVIEHLIEKGEKVLEKCRFSSDPYAIKNTNNIMAKIQLCKELKSNCRKRHPPKVVFLAGSPGTGKTVAMDRIIKLYSAVFGKSIDPALIGNVDIAVKHPAEGVSHKCKVLLINETIADCSEDDKKDKIPFDVYLQRFMDTAPLLFKSAKLENKGRAFCDVELIIITSNPMSFRFSSEPDKLERRFRECAICIQQELVEYNPEIKSYQVIKNNPNDPKFANVAPFIHFRLLRVAISGRILSFESDSTQTWISCPRFMSYLRDRFLTMEDRFNRADEMIKACCTCGVDTMSHFEGDNFIPLTPQCTPMKMPELIKHDLVCDCGVSVKRHSTMYDEIHWANSKYRKSRIKKYDSHNYPILEVPQLQTPEPEKVKEDIERALLNRGYTPTNAKKWTTEDILAESLGFIREVEERDAIIEEVKRITVKEESIVKPTGEYDIYLICFILLSGLHYTFPNASYAFYYRIYRNFKTLGRIPQLIEKASLLMDRIEGTREIVSNEVKFIQYNRTLFIEKMTQYAPFIAIFAAGAMLGTLYKYVSGEKKEKDKESLFTAGPILREQVLPDSMRIDQVVLEKNYPQELIDKWKKQTSYLPTAKLEKVRVTDDQLQVRLKSNVFRFRITYAREDNREVQKGYLTMINSQYGIINCHYIDGLNRPAFVETFHCNEEGDFSNPASSFCIDKGVVQPILNLINGTSYKTDLYLVRVPSHASSKSLVPYFPLQFDFSQCLGKVIQPSRNNTESNFSFGFSDIVTELGNSFLWLRVDKAEYGECGLPLVLNMKGGSALGGFVCIRLENGSDTFQGGNVVFQGDLLRAIDAFGEPFVNDIKIKDPKTSSLSVQSDFRDLGPKQNLIVVGTQPGSNAHFCSSFEKSRIHDDVYRRLTKGFGIPTKTRGMSGGEFITAIKQTFSKMPVNEIYNPSMVRMATTAYVNHIISSVKKKFPEVKLSPLTLEEVFFGDPVQQIDRCNFKSSVGPDKSLGRTRRDLFVDLDDKDFQLKLNEKFRDTYQDFKNEVAKGNLEAMDVEGVYKDEIRSLEKLELMKIRIFFLVSLYWNTLCKQYIGPIRAFLLRIPEISYIFAQINSSSMQWDELSQFLKIDNTDWLWIDMDFANFDMTHRILILEMARAAYDLGLFFYGNEEAAAICYYCFFILLVQIFRMKKDILIKSGGMPSGFDATLFINSFINVILMVYAFINLIPEKPVEEFFQLVKAATTGDDNLSAIHRSIAQRYNMITIAPLYECFGYKVTNSDKSGQIRPFVNKQEATFLKRKFRFEPAVGKRVAPIEEDSIWKMLAFSDKAGDLTSETERLSQCIENAQREFFFYGKDKFLQEQQFLRGICAYHHIYCRWFTFDELVVKFINNEFQMNWI